MKNQLTLIPTIIVNPSTIVIYNQIQWDPFKPSTQKQNYNEPEAKDQKDKFLNSSRKAEGKVSKIATRKITKAIDYLVTTAQDKKVNLRGTHKTVNFKIAFITLTLPSCQIHPDTIIINTCLNSLIGELKDYYKISRYVWRAEKQKNGNIHFHILVDKFVPWSELRDRWNRITNKLGYVDRHRDDLRKYHSSGFKIRKDLLKTWDANRQHIAYQTGKANDWANPNSTDIHSTKKIKNLRRYLTKYLTKNEETPQNPEPNPDPKHKQTGRIWGCCHELSNITGFTAEIDSEISEDLSKILRNKNIHKFESTYFTVYYLDYHELNKMGATNLFNYFTRYLYNEFDYSEQFKIA